jgi:prepilin-type processing-associated H-X9-DG protein
VYNCPDDSTKLPTGSTPDSYGMNVSLVNGNASYLPYDGYPQLTTAYGRQSQWNSPASTVLLFEVQGVTNVNATQTADQGSAVGLGSNSGVGGTQPVSNALSGSYATGNIGGSVLTSTPSIGVHTNGSNWLACDGHVKWLRGSSVSGGAPASAPNVAEVDGSSANTTTAAGTSNMTLANGSTVTLTFSPM